MRLVAYLFLLVFCFTFSNCETESSMRDELKQIAEEVNKKCPQMLDSETKFEGIDFKAPNGLIYKYTLINLSVQNVDTAQFKLALWPGILSTIKISPEMQKLRDNNTNIEYSYFDKTKKHIYTFKVSPKDYQ
jgi:cell division protein ZapA (FtsZ GTPase activity inhibitor)